MKAFFVYFYLVIWWFCFPFQNQSFRDLVRGVFFLVTKPFYPGIGLGSCCIDRKCKYFQLFQLKAFFFGLKFNAIDTYNVVADELAGILHAMQQVDI